jgi:predicted NAD/FAD-dependent oxidoreductase
MTKQLTIRILVATIALIVLSFAPSVARAHIGHQHQASIHTNHDHAASQDSDRSSPAALLQQAQWKESGTLPASERSCVGSCCSFACAACCAAALPSPVELAPFPRAIKRVALAPSRMGPDRKPESLRRPPQPSI